MIPVAFQNLGGGNAQAKNFGSPINLILGFSTIIIILVLNVWTRGFIQQIAILLGIVAASLLAVMLGQVGFEPVGQAQYFQLPQLFYFAQPCFEWLSIVTMVLTAITCMIESTGVYFALSEVVGQDLKEQDLAAGYRAEGLAAIFGGRV